MHKLLYNILFHDKACYETATIIIILSEYRTICYPFAFYKPRLLLSANNHISWKTHSKDSFASNKRNHLLIANKSYLYSC